MSETPMALPPWPSKWVTRYWILTEKAGPEAVFDLTAAMRRVVLIDPTLTLDAARERAIQLHQQRRLARAATETTP